MALANTGVLPAENSLPFIQLRLQKNSSVGYGCGALDEPRPTFGANLRALMKRGGVRATDVAAELGVVKSAVSGWLHDKVDLPNTQTLLRLAKAVHCSVDELLAGLDPEYDKVVRDLPRHNRDQQSGSSSHVGDQPNVPASPRILELESDVARLKAALDKISNVAGQLVQIAKVGVEGDSTADARPGRGRRDRKAG